jgi:hypothetical protein
MVSFKQKAMVFFRKESLSDKMETSVCKEQKEGMNVVRKRKGNLWIM